MNTKLPIGLRRELEAGLKAWREDVGADWPLKITQNGKRFAVNFGDWQDVTFDELCILIWGCKIGEGEEWAPYAREMRKK